MITLQHTLITLLGLRGDEQKLEEEIPYILIPDAIRKYSGPRPCSHFEEHPNRPGDISWMRFPIDLKNINKNTFKELKPNGPLFYLASDIPKSALGDKTSIPTFEKYNSHLPPEYYIGIKKHLTQDSIFDDWIRAKIDCSKKFDDTYSFNRKQYNGGEIRELITRIENQGLYILAYMLKKYHGITANQQWFDNHVKPRLSQVYSEDLANGTYTYMQIPEKINKWITDDNWSLLNDGPIPFNDYIEMYKKVAMEMPKIDFEKIERLTPPPLYNPHINR